MLTLSYLKRLCSLFSVLASPMQVLLNFLHGHGLHLSPTPPLPHYFTALGTSGPTFLSLFPTTRRKGNPSISCQHIFKHFLIYKCQSPKDQRPCLGDGGWFKLEEEVNKWAGFEKTIVAGWHIPNPTPSYFIYIWARLSLFPLEFGGRVAYKYQKIKTPVGYPIKVRQLYLFSLAPPPLFPQPTPPHKAYIPRVRVFYISFG